MKILSALNIFSEIFLENLKKLAIDILFKDENIICDLGKNNISKSKIIKDKNIANDIIKDSALRKAIELGPEELQEDQQINKEMQDMYDENESPEDILGYAINNNYGEGYYINNGYHKEGGSRRNKATPKPKAKPKHEDMTMKDIKEMCKANQIKLSKVVEGKRVVFKKKELITKLKRKKLL
jgi:hypothetical protein